MKIGVLALQGDFALHAKALGRCASATRRIDVVEVRKAAELSGLDGLIVPGGESTTLLRLMEDGAFVPALEKFHAEDRPLFGTCAGAIVMARAVENPPQFSLGLIDVAIERNAYGRQRESFEASGEALLDGRPIPIRMVFIRAPRIRSTGSGVRVLARHGGDPVLVQQGSVLVGTFHPELTDEPTVHQYFCDMVARSRGR
jgi:5'-phosphate synthase pdxT subunit